jgi:hypothetical protein
MKTEAASKNPPFIPPSAKEGNSGLPPFYGGIKGGLFVPERQLP